MDTNKLLFVDVETTIRNTVGKNKASAFCKDNFIVYSGVMRSGDGCVSIVNGPAEPPTDEGYAVVGHNIKFDLHHLRAANESWWEYVMRNGVWDTSIAEYLLTAQIEKYPSLDSCAVKYGGTVKDNRLKDEFWGKGIDTTEIPEDIILPYLEQDVLNTKIIAEAQIEEAERLGMMPLMRAMMSAMLATAEMEWNGLYVDLDRLESIQETLETERRSLLQKLEDEVIEMGLALPRDVLNLSSNKQLSAILFGGDVDYTDKEQIGFFKTGAKKGEPRYKNVQKSVMSKGLYTPKKEWENKLGYYSSSDDILSELFGEHGGVFLEGMLRLRWLNKQINTYAEGMKKLVMPDGLIHHSLQCTSTSTGRLSCTVAGTLVTTDRGEVPIEDVRIGDMVLTHRNRFRPVVATIDNDVQQVYEVKFSSGKVLTCTKDHSMLYYTGEFKSLDCVTKELFNVSIKDLDDERGKYKSVLGSIPQEGVLYDTENIRDAGYELPQCVTLRENTSPGVRIQGSEEDALRPFQGGREESDVWEDWGIASQLHRSSLGLQRVLYLHPRRKTTVCTSSSDGTGVRFRRNTPDVACPPYRWESSEQFVRQLSRMYSNWACGDTQSGDRTALDTIEKVERAGCHRVYDLTVLEDHSYYTNGVCSHNCTAPNLQNIPSQGESEIKAYFSSRFGDKGRIISADYSQLEVVWLAWAAGDENMKNDIKNGVDFHCKRLALKVGEPYDDVVRKCKVEELPEWVEMRKKIKTFSFQRSYGAGAAAISAATGMSVEEVKEIIKNEEKAYPQLTQFYKQIQLEVERSVSAAEKVYKIENGIPLKYGFYVSPTGRRYHFPQSVFTYYSKQEMKQKTEPSFSPTIIKNYPIQGGATGDLVPFMMAVLMHKLRSAGYGEKCLLINQVHDSIMLDTHEEIVYDVCQLVKETLEDAPRLLGKHFGLDFGLPLGVDVEFGLNWKEQEKYVSTKKETEMVQGLVEAVTKEPRQDKYDKQFYNGVKIGDNWYNFPPENTPAKGQVVEFEAPAKGNKIADFTVTDGSATAGQAGPKQGKLPTSVEGQIKGMILNNAVQMSIATANGQPLTKESIVAAAKVVLEARSEIDQFEIAA